MYPGSFLDPNYLSLFISIVIDIRNNDFLKGLIELFILYIDKK